MSFNAESTHPYIMNSRIKAASGKGGIGNIPIASSDTVGGIKVPADSGMSVDADGAISGVAYSTTEHKIGRKWIDGKDIYEKIIDYTGALSTTATTLSSGINYISNIIDARCIADNGTEGISPITVWLDGTDLKGRTVGNFSSQLLHIVIEYTKPTEE